MLKRLIGLAQPALHRARNDPLNIGRRQTADHSVIGMYCTLLERGGHIVAIEPARAALRKGRTHRLASGIEQLGRKRRLGHPGLGRHTVSPGLRIKQGAHALKQVGAKDGIMFAFVDRAAMNNLAQIDAVAQQMKQGAAAERLAAERLAVPCYVPL